MKNLNEHKKIAVLIDEDNAQHSLIKHILEEVSAHGHVSLKELMVIGPLITLKTGKSASTS